MVEKYSKAELANLPFRNSNLELEARVEDLLNRMTIEEKCSICSGRWWALFHTKPIKRLGINAYKMTDGPHGVGALGTFFTKKTTYFPVAICRCATWNPELSEKFGLAIAEEVRDVGYHMLLAPGVNIQRTPFCGRTFEYQTEDPYLNRVIAVNMVKGVQSKRIAACVKHYVCNNQEINRFRVSAEVNERTLREIYLPAFEGTVREADAWSFMGSYNKINGIYGCENKNTLKERLMEEWGFRGFVVSDWFATNPVTSTENCVNAGLSLEMPNLLNRGRMNKKKMLKAFQQGKFTEENLNENVRRLLRVMFLTGLFDDKKSLPSGCRNTPEHFAVARQIASEGIVLLKNENSLLPLDIEKIKKIAVLGPNANKKMAFGGGSSMIRAKYEITPLQGLKNKCKDKVEIISSAIDADVAIIVAGLNHKKHNDAENSDKTQLELPIKQIELINQTAKENKNTIVVLVNGTPITMGEWIENVPVIIEAWFAGMEGGNAIADILFGDINPSGKLPITFPKKIEDSPAHKSERTYPGEKIYNQKGKVIDEKVYYEEGIFVGYRHFDTKNIEPLFPFGFGLSYTTFSYENLNITPPQMSADDEVAITLDIINTGDRRGAEVIQLYVQDVKASVERPLKELKGFAKVSLAPGEKKSVRFTLSKHDLSFYDETKKSWIAEKGLFKIHIGSSSRDIRLQGELEYVE
ncbi:MAG TPA: glycoside hydrolase family 3 C-terminal domain-containing protein [Candidatus Deferrimicrobium sp.]|nr:glycoside hydrolase family 3 C-terminal domain-containing protein [Candidatus Deferrimicrobium sp.]